MYIICRKHGNASEVLRLECVGNCPEFVTHYLKYNISDSDMARVVVFKAEDVPLEEFVETIDETNKTSDSSTALQPEEKRKIVKKGKEKDCGCNKSKTAQ